MTHVTIDSNATTLSSLDKYSTILRQMITIRLGGGVKNMEIKNQIKKVLNFFHFTHII